MPQNTAESQRFPPGLTLVDTIVIDSRPGFPGGPQRNAGLPEALRGKGQRPQGRR
jgi:hypothetical protein